MDIDENDYREWDQNYKKFFYYLTLFHSVIIGRKKYGAPGWNNKYDWLTGDFETSTLIIQEICNQ